MAGLRGRNAIVTGGAGGIGRAIALAFARAGCGVAVVGLAPGMLAPGMVPRDSTKTTRAEIGGESSRVCQEPSRRLRQRRSSS